jgi:hypothetical protein
VRLKIQFQQASADNAYPSPVPEIMAQRRPAGLGRGDAASLKHVGSHFEPLTIVTNEEHAATRGLDLQGTPANRSHDSRHLPDVTKSAGNAPEWILVNRQPTAADKSSSSYNVGYGGHATSPNTDSQLGRTPIPHWHSETAKVQPWNGLGQVLRKSTTTTEVGQTRQGSKTSSMETHNDSTTRASFGDRNSYT